MSDDILTELRGRAAAIERQGETDWFYDDVADEIERLRAEIARLRITDAEREDLAMWLTECLRQCSAATEGGDYELAERWQGRAKRAASMARKAMEADPPSTPQVAKRTAAFSSPERKDMTMTDKVDEGSAAMRGSHGAAAAWGVFYGNGKLHSSWDSHAKAEDTALTMRKFDHIGVYVLPLYCSPTLTDEERATISAMAVLLEKHCWREEAAVFRGLLDRLT